MVRSILASRSQMLLCRRDAIWIEASGQIYFRETPFDLIKKTKLITSAQQINLLFQKQNKKEYGRRETARKFS